MNWLRLYHGTSSDDKWPLIARKSGQPIAYVVAVWVALLECASQADERGSIDTFDPESVDALLQMPEGTTQAIVDALSEGKRPRIINGCIANWEKRQPMREREDDNSTERTRQYRERLKALKNEKNQKDDASITPCDASVTPPERHVTPCDALDKIREEKNKNTKNQSTTGELDPARALEPQGECSDFFDTPGIEFQELREFYDEHCRAEAPLTGFAEYKQLRASRQWPGISRLSDAIDAHARADPVGWNSFCPGLAKFLREHWWEKKPSARASPPGKSQSPLSKNMQTTAAVLAARQQGRKAYEPAI